MFNTFYPLFCTRVILGFLHYWKNGDVLLHFQIVRSVVSVVSGVMRDQATLCLRNGQAYLSVFIVADDLKGPHGSGIFYQRAKTNHQAPHV